MTQGVKMGDEDRERIAVLENEQKNVKGWMKGLSDDIRAVHTVVIKLEQRLAVDDAVKKAGDGFNMRASVLQNPSKTVFYKSEAFWFRIVVYILGTKLGVDAIAGAAAGITGG